MIYSIQRFIRLMLACAVFAAHIAMPMVPRATSSSSIVGRNAVAASMARTLAGYRVLQNRPTFAPSTALAIQPQVQSGVVPVSPLLIEESTPSQPKKAVKSAFEPKSEPKRIGKPKTPATGQQAPAQEAPVAQAPKSAPKERQFNRLPWQLRRALGANPYLEQAVFDYNGSDSAQVEKENAELEAPAKKQSKKKIKKNKQAIQSPLAVEPIAAPAEIVAEQPMNPDMAITPEVVAMPEVQAPEIIFPAQQSAVIKQRMVRAQALNVFNPFVDALRELSMPHAHNQDAQLQNNVRQAILAAQEQGYRVGLIEQNVAERMQGIPGAQKLLLGDNAAGSMIISNNALGIAGIEQAPAIANVLGLSGAFIPFMVKNAQNKPLLSHAMLELIQGAGNQNNPLAFDRSQIIMQPVMPSIEGSGDANMGMANINNGPEGAPEVAQGSGAGNGNNAGGRNAFAGNPGEDPGIKRAQPIPGQQNIPGNIGNPARALGAGGLSDDGNIVEPIERNYAEPIMPISNPIVDQPEAADKNRGNESGERKKIHREHKISDEDTAIWHYGSLILAALEARISLNMLWAGKSDLLKKMFVSYNNLWAAANKYNDVYTSGLYDGSRHSIHVVVSDILARLMSN